MSLSDLVSFIFYFKTNKLSIKGHESSNQSQILAHHLPHKRNTPVHKMDETFQSMAYYNRESFLKSELSSLEESLLAITVQANQS